MADEIQLLTVFLEELQWVRPKLLVVFTLFVEFIYHQVPSIHFFTFLCTLVCLTFFFPRTESYMRKLVLIEGGKHIENRYFYNKERLLNLAVSITVCTIMEDYSM